MISLLFSLLIVGQPPRDNVSVSFAFFGCNRIEKDDWKATKAQNPSSANLPQIQQSFRDIANLKVIPQIVFGGGDLVLGYGNDNGEETYGQLTAWRKLFYQSPLVGKTIMVPFPGNHELNKKIDKLRLPNPPTVNMWSRWFKESGWRQMGKNGPTDKGKNLDQLVDDQSLLNYSFDIKGVHFVVLNTDTLTKVKEPKTGSTKVAWIPANWAASDISRAQKNPKIKTIFVLGHRNLVDGISSKGDSPIDATPGAKLLAAIRENRKVRAYVCAHVHTWDLKNLGGRSKAWQVVAGNGGSKLEDDWKPANGTYFGFITVEVLNSGKVVLHNFRRPLPAEPQKYNDGFPVRPESAKPVDTVLYDPAK